MDFFSEKYMMVKIMVASEKRSIACKLGNI